ncbi:MAG: hypothetical protein J6C13_03580 [Clostridia bacterium]|nr:hypothetical protein [Clostridia bacterium]
MAKMKKSPYKLLVCFVENKKVDYALQILKNGHETLGLSSFVEGTSRLGVMDNIMGLARNQRVMLTCFVRSKNATRTLQALDLLLCPDGKSFGIAFTIDLSSISRESLNYFISKQVVE